MVVVLMHTDIYYSFIGFIATNPKPEQVTR
jgi:hypothetical protein